MRERWRDRGMERLREWRRDRDQERGGDEERDSESMREILLESVWLFKLIYFIFK
jgi:sugar phosphate permease